MKYLVRLSALVALAAVMAFAAIGPATAQTPAADPEEALNEIASDVTVYGRSYEADMSGTPVPDAEMPVTVILQAYAFDDADVAVEAFPHVEQLMKNELEPVVGTELVTEEVDDLGDMATLSTGEVEQAGTSVTIALLMVQQDEAIYLSAGVAMNGPADGVATDFMTFMLDGEPGDAEAAEYMADGTSTGGYFDVFPTEADTDLLQGMMVTEDYYDSTQ